MSDVTKGKAQREMALREIVGKFPPAHRARREFLQLRRCSAYLAAALSPPAFDAVVEGPRPIPAHELPAVREAMENLTGKDWPQTPQGTGQWASLRDEVLHHPEWNNDMINEVLGMIDAFMGNDILETPEGKSDDANAV